MKAGLKTTLQHTRRGLLFAGGLAAVLALLVRVGHHHYPSLDDGRIAALAANPDNLEAVVWGSSHAESVDLDIMGLKGENLFFVAQDLFEIEYKVRALAPKLPKLRTALVSISYFSFHFDNRISLKGKRDRGAIRVQMYATYPKTLPWIAGDSGRFALGLLYPLVTTDHWRRVVSPKPLSPPTPPRSVPPRPEVRTLAAAGDDLDALAVSPSWAAYLRRHAEERCTSYGPLIENMLRRHPRLTTDALEAATRFVTFLQKRGVRVVLFTPPFYREYNRLFEDEWQDDMRDAVSELEARTGVEYHDFSRDPEFERSPQFFKNADHLSEPAAALFSLKLKRSMDTAGIRARPE